MSAQRIGTSPQNYTRTLAPPLIGQVFSARGPRARQQNEPIDHALCSRPSPYSHELAPWLTRALCRRFGGAAVLPGGVSSGEGAWRAGSRWGGCHGGCLPLPRGQLAPRCAPRLSSVKDVLSDPNLLHEAGEHHRRGPLTSVTAHRSPFTTSCKSVWLPAARRCVESLLRCTPVARGLDSPCPASLIATRTFE